MTDNEKRYPQSKAEPDGPRGAAQTPDMREELLKTAEKEPPLPVTMMVYAGPGQMANGGGFMMQNNPMFALSGIYAGQPEPDGGAENAAGQPPREDGRPSVGFCPNCGRSFSEKSPFCPDCGSKMKWE